MRKYKFIIDDVKKIYSEKDKYQSFISNYTRDKEICFNNVLFVDEAKTIIERTNQYSMLANSKLLDEAQEKIEQYKSQLAREARKSNYINIDSNKDELIKAYEQIKKTQEANKTLNNEIDRLNKELKKKNSKTRRTLKTLEIQLRKK